ncbi:hypothetical protein [Tessaracoccus flavus]|uniref:Uncharacterized protein n=1 Tax=Tessaracoccus flavus TaxID=1610493 RepID=A0A1Q2CBQ5_9ACTN|nr:hypothetical protein [Tessaracoccus flavus]AQP43539.1 hypothetical protein RPIT_00820 [Tessaracoccus flavus]SDY86528.1 hypothetical protein SAMN05428934_105117 [Tessaracoccus flavus]
MAEPPSKRSRRWVYAAAAAAAAVIAIVFTVVGDGVAATESAGWLGVVVDWGHQLVWALLAAAFTVAAVRDGWTKPSQILAVGALALYAAFLAAVFLG